jgi:hypothetical protein
LTDLKQGRPAPTAPKSFQQAEEGESTPQTATLDLGHWQTIRARHQDVSSVPDAELRLNSNLFESRLVAGIKLFMSGTGVMHVRNQSMTR